MSNFIKDNFPVLAGVTVIGAGAYAAYKKFYCSQTGSVDEVTIDGTKHDNTHDADPTPTLPTPSKTDVEIITTTPPQKTPVREQEVKIKNNDVVQETTEILVNETHNVDYYDMSALQEILVNDANLFL